MSPKDRTRSDDLESTATGAPLRSPGKQTRSDRLVVQQKAGAAADPASAVAPSPGVATTDDPFGVHLLGGASSAGDRADGTAVDHALSGPTTSLPFLDEIQRSFGHHDVSGVAAHVGGAASTGLRSLHAHGLAAGNEVALARGDDLHTAAHEAAHVVQQRAGVSLKGGVGEVGDEYERHADLVADRVVRGESAAALLDQRAGASASISSLAGVQFRMIRTDAGYADYRSKRDDQLETAEAWGEIDKEDVENILALKAGRDLPFPADAEEEKDDAAPDIHVPDNSVPNGILKKDKILYSEKDTGKKKQIGKLKAGAAVTIVSESPGGMFGRSWIELQSDLGHGFINSKAGVVKLADSKGGGGGQGYLEKAKCWVRLHTSGLIVIAENHSEITMLDLVQATGTTSYQYEGFTDGPGDEYGEVNEAMSARKAKLAADHGVGPPKRGHEGEDFFAKTLSALATMRLSRDQVDDGVGDAPSQALRWAILYAAAQSEESAMRATYLAHQALLDDTAAQLAGANLTKIGLFATPDNRAAVAAFRDSFVAFATPKMDAEAAAGLQADDAEWFDTQYGKRGLTFNAAHANAEKSREKSMMKHIRRGAESGLLLYAAGEVHINKLGPLLDQHGITWMSMNEYIKTHQGAPSDAK